MGRYNLAPDVSCFGMPTNCDGALRNVSYLAYTLVQSVYVQPVCVQIVCAVRPQRL